jgi:hypothetical protein
MIEYRRESMTRVNVFENGENIGYIKDSCCYTLIKSNNIKNAIRVDYQVGKGGLLANNYKTNLHLEFKRSGSQGNYNDFLGQYEAKVMSGEIVGEYDLALKEIFKRSHENKAYPYLANSTTIMISVNDIVSGKYLTSIESKKFKVFIEDVTTKKSTIHYTTIAEYPEFIEKFSDTTKYKIR